MKYKVFIDGQEGTTGIQIYERFQNREDIELLRIDESLRKDLSERKRLIAVSDFTFLCLPDIAAKEAVELAASTNTKILDASTAHRINPNWAYGLPELSKEHRQRIANASRVAVPGCYASGFITLAYPLLKAGIMASNHLAICHAVSGYSGGGKKMIAEYETENRASELCSPRQYSLAQSHKHLPEMQVITGLDFPPMFNPIVDNYYSGMVVSLPLITRTLAKKSSPKEIHETLASHYKGEHFIKVMDFCNDGFIAANSLANTNTMQIFVSGNDEQVLLASRFDNLGKGASGAAIQCMNIMMGIDETTGLTSFE